MARIHGDSARIYVNQFNLSGRANSVDLDMGVPLAPVTAFEDVADEFVGGKNGRGFTLDVRSWADMTDDEIDEILFALVASGPANLFGVYLDGSAAGSHGYELVGALERDTVRFPHDNAGALDFVARGGQYGRAMKLLEAVAITATGGQTGQSHMTAASGDLVIYVARVTAVGGAGSITLQLQESSDGGGDPYAQVGSIALTFTAVGAQRTTAVAGATLGPFFRDNVSAYATFTSVTVRTAVAVLPNA